MSGIENLRDTITPKSDQLNADDLVSTTMIVKVTAVKRGSSAEQPVSIEYENMNGRPYKPCKSMRRVLLASWGDDGREWVGRKMQLFCDPEVKFGGVKIGGIRISHLSDIENDLEILLATARGKRSQYNVKKLIDKDSFPEAMFDSNFDAWVSGINKGEFTLDRVLNKISKEYTISAAQLLKLKDAITDKPQA